MTDQQVIAEEAEGCPAILNLSGVGEFLAGEQKNLTGLKICYVDSLTP
jgi:hypothetical protein